MTDSCCCKQTSGIFEISLRSNLHQTWYLTCRFENLFLTELEYYYNILCTYIFVELLPDLFILTLMFGFNKKKSVPAYYRSLCLLINIVNCVMHIADQNSLIPVLKKIQTFHFSHKRTSLVYLYTNHVRIIMLQPVHYLLIFFFRTCVFVSNSGTL